MLQTQYLWIGLCALIAGIGLIVWSLTTAAPYWLVGLAWLVFIGVCVGGGLFFYLRERVPADNPSSSHLLDIRAQTSGIAKRPTVDTDQKSTRNPFDLPLLSDASPVPAVAAKKPDTAPNLPVATKELAHDLKNPLNALIGFASLMEQQAKGPMPEAYRDYPGLIRQSGETIQHLIDEFMRSAEATPQNATDLVLRPVALDQAARDAIARFSIRAEAKQIELVLIEDAQPVQAKADPLLMTRILDNLLSNALKYSEVGGKVFVLVQKREDGAYLGVRDLGAGMSAADLQRIGKRFVQGDNARGRAGSGLGLSIVTQLTELQSGALTVRSAPGEGTEVEVRLPFAALDGAY